MISQEAVEKILGLENNTDISAEKMAKKLSFTFFPFDEKKCSKEVLVFKDLLCTTLNELGVKIVPYSDVLETVPIAKIFKRFIKISFNNFLYILFEVLRREHGYYHIHPGTIVNLFKRNRIRKGVVIVALGENKTTQLPIDYSSSFTKNPVITILDCPTDINESTVFSKHFDTAMNIFSYHMTQIAVLVSKQNFIVYNFNASHPIYPLHTNFKNNILKALIPKVAAPIKPPLLSEFIIESEAFDINSELYRNLTNDLVRGAKIFDKTNLYPAGKKVDSLPFRSGFYKWIGKIHLDHRSGMSYGFLAKQIPSKPEILVPLNKLNFKIPELYKNLDYFEHDGNLHIIVNLLSKKYCLRIPPVWVLSQRSGSNKTNIDLSKDVLLLGLVNGKMHLQTPKGTKLMKDYKPSFDTRVILAHAVGNAIISSILNFIDASTGKQSKFSNQMIKNGAAIIHWHGYIRSDLVPMNWHTHGNHNPHVACSTPQSAIYALGGKLDTFEKILESKLEYYGDIHVEPHHGTNINFTSISDFANFLINTPNSSELGNKYLVESMLN